MHNCVLCEPKRRNFHLWKVSGWKFFRFQSSCVIYRLWPLMYEQQIQLWEKSVTMSVRLFGLTNKSTWPDWFDSGAKINCDACLWIRSLPVSVVTARIRHWWLCIIFTLLDQPLMTGLSIFQTDPSTFYFKFWLGSVVDTTGKSTLITKFESDTMWHKIFARFCDFSSNLPK